MSTPDLFPPDAGRMDSPRLAWLKKHGLITQLHDRMDDDYADLEPWVCHQVIDRDFRVWGLGNTEDEACADYAQRNGIPLWNEET